MMMICDETYYIKLMRTHRKQAKLHSCFNKYNLTLFSCFGNVDTDIVGIRQQNFRFLGKFYRPYQMCVLK